MMDNRNLIVAIALSLAIMLGFNYLYEIPRQKERQQQALITAAEQPAATPLTPEHPVTLTWDNGQGLHFIRQYAIDRNFMITVAQRVENTGSADVTLYPYGLISRSSTPQTLGYYILFEGLIGRLNGTLREV